jgi:hypothetical protein
MATMRLFEVDRSQLRDEAYRRLEPLQSLAGSYRRLLRDDEFRTVCSSPLSLIDSVFPVDLTAARVLRIERHETVLKNRT